MNIQIMDTLGVCYRSIFANKEVFIAENGCAITKEPFALHFPMKAPNGELLVAHGIPGIPMEVGKLLLATREGVNLEDITGYQYINKKLGLSSDNLKIVPAEDSALNLKDDFLIHPEGLKKVYYQRGENNGHSSTIPQMCETVGLSPKEVIAELIAGGGYCHLDEMVISINRYFKTLAPFLSREGIIRLGTPACYNEQTNKREFGSSTLGGIWEMCTERKKSDKEVYDIITELGSAVHENFHIRFEVGGKVRAVKPARRRPPIV